MNEFEDAPMNRGDKRRFWCMLAAVIFMALAIISALDDKGLADMDDSNINSASYGYDPKTDKYVPKLIVDSKGAHPKVWRFYDVSYNRVCYFTNGPSGGVWCSESGVDNRKITGEEKD